MTEEDTTSDRRGLLRTIGAIGLGAIGFTGVASADDSRKKGRRKGRGKKKGRRKGRGKKKGRRKGRGKKKGRRKSRGKKKGRRKKKRRGKGNS